MEPSPDAVMILKSAYSIFLLILVSFRPANIKYSILSVKRQDCRILGGKDEQTSVPDDSIILAASYCKSESLFILLPNKSIYKSTFLEKTVKIGLKSAL